VANAVVAAAMRGRDDALPLLLLDGRIVAQGAYPAREALAGLVGLTAASASATGTAIGGEAAPKACCTPKAPKDAAAPKSCCTPKDETAAGAGKCC
jgi:hypothetical protein